MSNSNSGRGSRAPRASSIAARPKPRAKGRPGAEAEADSKPEDPDASDSTALVGEIGRELAALFSVIGRGAQALDKDAARDRARAGRDAGRGKRAKASAAASSSSAGASLDASASLLRELQLGLLRYPVATQAAFRALVAEGRRFAASPDGTELEARLLASPEFRRLRRIYESLTWHMLEERGESTLPSNYLDALAQVIGLDHLEPFLAALHSVTKR